MKIWVEIKAGLQEVKASKKEKIKLVFSYKII